MKFVGDDEEDEEEQEEFLNRIVHSQSHVLVAVVHG